MPYTTHGYMDGVRLLPGGARMTAVGVLGWGPDAEWRGERKRGIGGSDIAAVLGFSSYRTPWHVWAEKTGRRSWQDDMSVPAELGLELEPWLEGKARQILGVEVTRTEWRTYAHSEHGWRRVSPDGITADGRLTEYKTAGLASGWGTPAGWDNGRIPLGYEFQTRWALHVMDMDVCEIVALVAGLGVVHRTVKRDLAIEATLVAQVDEWYQRHIVHDEEPAVGAADNEALGKLYPVPTVESVDLTNTDVHDHWLAYRHAAAAIKEAELAQDEAAAAIKQLMGNAAVATVNGKAIATWNEAKGAVDWQRMLADLAEEHDFTPPDPDTYRKPPTRKLLVKDPK